MKKLIARFWFFITGWKLVFPHELTNKVEHSVVVAAPHTSNWDFPYAIFAFWLMDIDLKYFIKDDYTKSILGWFFKWTGALGVDRSKQNNLVEHSVDVLNENKKMVILVPAEGTRKKVDKWRTGFYTIASKANVPICLGFLDYEKKIAGLGKIIEPTGNFEADMQIIETFFLDKKGKHPELYNPKIY